jgi:hypothetical protein
MSNNPSLIGIWVTVVAVISAVVITLSKVMYATAC